ncbi:hypothetical protein SAMN02982929_01276 [Saccharopolyspora kobensis]|uniref:Chromosome segregation ATPase n=1 Tax=Saccharopolyspora kobensis TaxID=146035 RepID=A0A1H5WQT4_9PSEU|nr:hypothetical protein SAMN02982929_01276 [Saccharopolyspora kobensis]SFD78605.1 hypothetical protein SAMN05216506_106252 [Saccharopolyspora kobensis]
MSAEVDGLEGAEITDGQGRVTAPARRGSREQRREVTLRALAAGEEAFCAYCGQVLPPLPPRGGRPTPYCPADPDRYGNWGAKTITCAMLDEHREIWVQVYGPDQPMTRFDVHTLDERLTVLHSALDPVRQEVAALQAHTAGELASALAAREAAESERQQAVQAARSAEVAREQAASSAELARSEAEEARKERAAAEEQARRAESERDRAFAERDEAQQAAESARSDRQRALAQLTDAQDRITELQRTLADERAVGLERLDQLRREEEQVRQELRAALTENGEQRLRAQAEEHALRLQNVQDAADRRIAKLTDQLAEAAHNYAGNLAPLHGQLDSLRSEAARCREAEAAARRELAELRNRIASALDSAGDDAALRKRVESVLEPGDPAADRAPGSSQ